MGKGPGKRLRGKNDREWTRSYCFKKRTESTKVVMLGMRKTRHGYGRWLIHSRICCKGINMRYLY